MCSILTEGRVSSLILSFGDKSFLFTGTVCRSWFQNSSSTETSVQESIESLSRLREAVRRGINPYSASYWSLRNGSDLSIIKQLNEETCYWDQPDIEYAAELGRIDVLRLMREKGYFADERVLHTAVRYNRSDVVKYLVSIGTPVDKTVIEWGFGPYIIDELKMRSMEVAIVKKNLPIVKILRTVNYPFTEDSFTFACENRDVEMLEYIVEQGCQPSDGLFIDSVESRDFFTVEFLIDNLLLRDEWDLWGTVCDDDKGMMLFLLDKGIIPTDDDVDSAICGGHLDTAKFLTNTYKCRPTPLAYMLVFENLMCDCHYIELLNWLYHDMQCSLGFVLLEEMRNDPCGAKVLSNCSGAIEDWFRERLY